MISNFLAVKTTNTSISRYQAIFLKRYVNECMKNNTIKKIVWSAKEEIERVCKNDKSITNWFDLQYCYKGLSLKRVIGNKYNLKCIVNKDIYCNKFNKPTRDMLQYAAIDILVMKELYNDITL